jgi:cytochrome P450 family 3 subfamily A
MRQYVGAFAMDVISACAYGINTDSVKDPNDPIVVNVKKILNVDVNISLFLSVSAPPIARFLKLEPFDIKATNYFDALTNKIIEERKKFNQTQEISNYTKSL